MQRLETLTEVQIMADPTSPLRQHLLFRSHTLSEADHKVLMSARPIPLLPRMVPKFGGAALVLNCCSGWLMMLLFITQIGALMESIAWNILRLYPL